MDHKTPPDIQEDDKPDDELSDLHRQLGLSAGERKVVGQLRAAQARRRAEEAAAEVRPDRACDRCDFYRPNPPMPFGSEDVPRHERRGECRRAAPAAGDGHRRFPMVRPHEWCGDWAADTRPSDPPIDAAEEPAGRGRGPR